MFAAVHLKVILFALFPSNPDEFHMSLNMTDWRLNICNPCISVLPFNSATEFHVPIMSISISYYIRHPTLKSTVQNPRFYKIYHTWIDRLYIISVIFKDPKIFLLYPTKLSSLLLLHTNYNLRCPLIPTSRERCVIDF